MPLGNVQWSIKTHIAFIFVRNDWKAIKNERENNCENWYVRKTAVVIL